MANEAWSPEPDEGDPDEGVYEEERDPWPSPEEIEQEERFHAAHEAIEKKKKGGMFTQVVLDLKKRDALGLWIAPPDKERGRQIRGTIDTTVGLRISKLIHTPGFPWKNESDFVRSAISFFLSDRKLESEGEYKGYFALYWKQCADAQLVRALRDTVSLVTHLTKAVDAFLALDQIDEAAKWLRGKVDELTVQDDDFSRKTLEHLESVMTTGGPGRMAVWRRV